MKELQISHWHQLKDRFSDQARVHDDAIHGLRKQYADRIEDAEAKFRQYKTPVALIEDLKDYVQDLEREKSASTLAEAAVEKEVQDLTSQAKAWQGYENGYTQINDQYIHLQAEHNDMIAERDDLLRKLEAFPDTLKDQDLTASAQPSTPMQTGTIKSADRDIGMLENYWGTEKQFAEMKMRRTATDIATVDADIAEITRQLAALEKPGTSPVGDPETSESNNEHNGHMQPAGSIISQLPLLDTIARPIATTDSDRGGYVSSNPGQAQEHVYGNGQHRHTTWASTAALPEHGNNAPKRVYVH
jgi:hypothetical protein